MWRTAWARRGVEAGDVLDLAADQVVAERDLALQAAEVGEVDRQRVVVVGLGLADVVEEGAGDGDVAVDAGEEVGGGGDRLRDRERVLEQPVAVGLVVDLRRRRVAEAGPRSPSPRRRRGRAARAAAGSGSSRAAARRSASSRSTGTSEPVARSASSYSPGGGLAQRGELDLRPPALAVLEGAGDEDAGAPGGERVERLGVLPGDRLDGAAGVAERSAAARVAVALAPQLTAADRVDAAAPAARPRARAAGPSAAPKPRSSSALRSSSAHPFPESR